MTVTQTESRLSSFDLGMIRLLQTVNRRGNVKLRTKVEMDEQFWDRLCTRLSWVGNQTWEFVLAYDRDRDRLVIGAPATNRTKLVSVVIDRNSDNQHRLLLRCPKLQRIKYHRVITTSMYTRAKGMAEEVLDELEWTATRALKEYEASGRALWT
jgi:hypothetical protein